MVRQPIALHWLPTKLQINLTYLLKISALRLMRRLVHGVQNGGNRAKTSIFINCMQLINNVLNIKKRLFL